MLRLACLALVVGCSADAKREGAAVAIARDQHGVPRLITARDLAPAPAATAMQSAQAHVERLAAMWGVAPGKLPDARPASAKCRCAAARSRACAQVIDGLPVWGRELRVLVRPGGELATASGTLRRTHTPRTLPCDFATDEAGAIARAANGTAVESASLAKRGGMVRASGRLVAAWVVEAYTSREARRTAMRTAR